MRVWMLRVGAVLLGGALLTALLGALGSCDHNPNHDINLEQARAAARRVHATPEPGIKRGPDHGG